MSRFALALLAALCLLAFAAQEPTSISKLDRLEIQLWPDYDRPAVLVLLTGVLPPGTSQPATVQVPIPGDATLHVVARISNTSEMFDDMSYDAAPAGGGQQLITFTTPDLRFRVEYYLPYTATGNERGFAFTWQSALEIDQLALLVQQPAQASSFATTPAAPAASLGAEGLNYHAFTEQPLGAGQPFTLRVDYVLSPPQLSADALATRQGAGTLPGFSGGEPAAIPTSNWPALIGAVVAVALLGVGVWWLLWRRPPALATRPGNGAGNRQPLAAAGKGPRFCHQCGQPFRPDDRFCRKCGAALRQS